MHIRLRESNLLASSVCVFLVSPPSLSSFPFFPSLDPSSSELLSANQRAPLPLSYFHIARIITKYEAAVAADGGAERSERRADARLAVRWGGRGRAGALSDPREGTGEECGWLRTVVEKYDLIRKPRRKEEFSSRWTISRVLASSESRFPGRILQMPARGLLLGCVRCPWGRRVSRATSRESLFGQTPILKFEAIDEIAQV